MYFYTIVCYFVKIFYRSVFAGCVGGGWAGGGAGAGSAATSVAPCRGPSFVTTTKQNKVLLMITQRPLNAY